MLEAAFWAFLASASLLVGVEIALALRPSRTVIGLVMAFGAGAMISAVSYELVLEAVEKEQHVRVVTGMALGSLAFLCGTLLIERRNGKESGSPTEQEEGSPLAIALGATLDAIPESLIIGLTVVLTGGASVSFVAATFLSNLPESMSSTSGLLATGWERQRIRLLWLGVVCISVLAGALGYLIFNSAPRATGAFVEGFAAGALLTMLADTMMPEAFRFGGRPAGILTVAGFVLALAVSEV